jgi:hypothetical protein
MATVPEALSFCTIEFAISGDLRKEEIKVLDAGTVIHTQSCSEVRVMSIVTCVYHAEGGCN